MVTQIFDDAHAFVSSIVAQSPAITRVLVMAAAVSHCVEEFSQLPRVAFLSDDMRTGKTTAVKVAAMLSANPFKITRATTDPTVLTAFNTYERPTIVIEETSEIFGRDGRGQKKPNLRLLVLDGCDRGAVSQFTRGGSVETVSTFCLVFAAGRGAGFPDDGRDRAIICPMRRTERRTVPADDQDAATMGAILSEQMRTWVQDNRAAIGALAREIGEDVHPDLVSRRRDVWSAVFAMAHAIGGDWPRYILGAFRELALGNSDAAGLSAENRIRLAAGEFVRSSTDLPTRVDGTAILRSSVMLTHLRTIDAFRTFRDRTLQMMIVAALGDSRSLTPADGTKVKGWDIADILALCEHVEAEMSVPREVRTVVVEDF